ncbi:MAG: DNA cytosine methyltransferase [Deltaproteobacteria bacterium]|nr:DNA cytosine methyltransferase [Deltaproteobacteria bacterium]
MFFRFGELFCGPGGLAWAAKNASVTSRDKQYSIQHAWATDYDRDTCNTYRTNICPDAPETVVCHDIRKLDYSKLTKISDVDAIAFGFPCNDFSVVGKQKGINGVYGPLYSYGVKAISEFKPKWFLAENVGGLRNANDGGAFTKILQSLFNEGYSVYPHLYKFEQYGVPQARHRIIIVGIRKDLDICFKIPSSNGYGSKSCRDAIEEPPIDKNANNQELTKQSKTVVERLKYIKPGENAFTADIPEHLQLKVKGAKISQIYKRLDPEKPAYTVTGSGGGGTHVYHWEENRALTNRERARLQTFPDDFTFCGSKESVRKQIGMAVPPQGVRVIFQAILKCFAGVDYEREESNMIPYIQSEHLKLYNQAPFQKQLRLCEKKLEFQVYGE